MTLVFLDTETTSLNRLTRRAWEVALIRRDDEGVEVEHSFFIGKWDLDLATADPMSLKIGGFHDRHPQYAFHGGELLDESTAAATIEELTRGATLVGAVPNFDEHTLDSMLRRNDLSPAWHYHLVDVETLAAGALRIQPPWGFDDLLATYGLTYDEADRHTALGDARMARDLYDAVMSGKAPVWKAPA